MKRQLALLCLCLFPSLAHAGAWTQEKGAAQLITTASYSNASHFYNKMGRSQSQSTYQSAGVSIYGEYGLKDYITLGGQLAAGGASQSSNSNSALLDSEVFARLRLWKNDQAVFSIQPYLVIPSHLHTTNMPALGSKDYSAGLRSAYGQNYELWGKKGYFDAAVSYQYRAGKAGDQIKFDLTSELNITGKWSVMPQIFITRSRDNIGKSAFSQSTADDYNLTTLQLSGLYKLTDTSKIQAGVFDNAWGKNTGAGRGVLVGYWLNF